MLSDDRFNTGHEDCVIFEPCFEGEGTNMVVLDGSPTSCFYLHLPFIHDLKVLVLFMSFEFKFLVTANASLL